MSARVDQDTDSWNEYLEDMALVTVMTMGTCC